MRRNEVLIAAAVSAMTLVGCGSNSHTAGAAPPGSSTRNAADLAFVQTMIPAQQQASEMVRLVGMHGASHDVTTFASHMGAAQAPALAALQGCLSTWRMSAMMSRNSDNAKVFPGMMSTAAMLQLRGMSGQAFDRSFLTMMEAHHQGAIRSARTELAHGRYGPAKAIATTMTRVDSAEIVSMMQLMKAT